MSQLTELQEALVKYKNDKLLSQQLNEIKASPNWKAIIENGFIQETTSVLVNELVESSSETRNEHLAVLTGISALNKYLNTITINGTLAKERITATEEAIAELLGENYE